MKTNTFLRATLLAVAIILQSVTLLLADNLTPKEQKGKWGYVNASGAWVIKPKYEMAEPFNKAYATVCKKGKWGLINESGKEIYGCKYSKFTFLNDGTIYAKEASTPSKGILMNINTREEYKMTEIKETELDEKYFALSYTVGFSWKVDSKDMYKTKGFLASRDGNILYNNVKAVKKIDNNILCIEPQSDQPAEPERKPITIYAILLKDSLNILGNYTTKVGSYSIYGTSFQSEDRPRYMIDKEGNILTSTDYDHKIYKNSKGKVGLFVDSEWKLPTQYDYIVESEYYQDVFYLRKDELWGLYNAQKGKIQIPCLYPSKVEEGKPKIPFIRLENENGFIVYKDGKYGLLDINGDEILPIEYDNYNYKYDYNEFIQSERSGSYEKSGSYLTDRITLYKDNYAALYDLKERKFLVNTGKYSDIGHFSHGNSFVNIGNKVGLVKSNGEVLVPVKYAKLIYPIDPLWVGGTLYPAQTEKGSIDYYCRGKLIIPAGKFSREITYNDLKEKVIIVKKNGKFGAINYNGAQVVPCIYDEFVMTGREDRLAFSNNTYTGWKIFILSSKGSVLKTATFNRSQKYALATFVENWL